MLVGTSYCKLMKIRQQAGISGVGEIILHYKMLMGHQRTLFKDNEDFKILKCSVHELNGSAENVKCYVMWYNKYNFIFL